MLKLYLAGTIKSLFWGLVDNQCPKTPARNSLGAQPTTYSEAHVTHAFCYRKWSTEWLSVVFRLTLTATVSAFEVETILCTLTDWLIFLQKWMGKKVQDSSVRYRNVSFTVHKQRYRFDVRNLKSKQAHVSNANF